MPERRLYPVPDLPEPETPSAYQPEKRRAVSEMLSYLAEIAATDQVAGGVCGAAVVLLTDDAPQVAWTGLTWDQLADARSALSDAYVTRYSTADRDVQELVAERWRQRRQAYEAMERQRQERIAAKPWECSGDRCNRRFATERGARQHERHCRTRITTGEGT